MTLRKAYKIINAMPGWQKRYANDRSKHILGVQMTEEKSEYKKHVNEWCSKCKNYITAGNCKKCYLPDISDDGRIGKPSEFEQK